jgi:hypothetical protein
VRVESRGGRHFLVYSSTPGLVAASSWSAPSRLAPALADAASALLGRRYWSVVELTDAVRRRLIANTGVQGGGTFLELQQLQQIWFTGQIVDSNDIDLELSGKYRTAEEAATLGLKLGRWLPFPNRPEHAIQGSSARFVLHHVTFQQLNVFLSHF